MRKSLPNATPGPGAIVLLSPNLQLVHPNPAATPRSSSAPVSATPPQAAAADTLQLCPALPKLCVPSTARYDAVGPAGVRL